MQNMKTAELVALHNELASKHGGKTLNGWKSGKDKLIAKIEELQEFDAREKAKAKKPKREKGAPRKNEAHLCDGFLPKETITPPRAPSEGKKPSATYQLYEQAMRGITEAQAMAIVDAAEKDRKLPLEYLTRRAFRNLHHRLGYGIDVEMRDGVRHYFLST